jgi:hypothetical protein
MSKMLGNVSSAMNVMPCEPWDLPHPILCTQSTFSSKGERAVAFYIVALSQQMRQWAWIDVVQIRDLLRCDLSGDDLIATEEGGKSLIRQGYLLYTTRYGEFARPTPKFLEEIFRVHGKFPRQGGF